MESSTFNTATTNTALPFNTFNEPQHCYSPPPESYQEGYSNHYPTSSDILAWGKHQQQQQHLNRALTTNTTMFNEYNYYTQPSNYTSLMQPSPSTISNNDSGFEQQQPSPLYNYNASPDQQHFYYPSFKREDVILSPQQQQLQYPITTDYYFGTTASNAPTNAVTITTTHNTNLYIPNQQPIKTEEEEEELFDEEDDRSSSSLSAKKAENDNNSSRRQQHKGPERKRQRKESHNAIERRRRNNINDNIKYLGELLPENLCQGKISKGTILKGSVTYIHMLNSQLAQCKARLQQLEYEVAAFNSYNISNSSSNNNNDL
ncbi:hypothetical protein BDF20DRAFT_853130 [Mycotypha africana]|uniref:uncharacterized protein n=1 Tax=Mycotypha africana TaxID=64632 RepID=UPI0023019578|nr:uncharacterized protein BDF20DRAFT_853130 [Mycotypha africana]KAI8987978.1 hypothetical protein BDF20DRAFT_853130 [Mycotypha africana]